MSELTADQAALLKTHFIGNTTRACPMCTKTNWGVGPIIHGAIWHPGGGMVLGGPAVPMALLICNSCSYVALFSAVAIGLVPPTPNYPPKKGEGT